ncbi:hypothetical protein [Sphaerisporangium aureirubrum]|uniref:Tetratricopeptide repeat protein n=1 Tax=Sphaerisporangium aureirubrum TaxID=1544736 RepID=A0ABW1NH74_9ACTN
MNPPPRRHRVARLLALLPQSRGESLVAGLTVLGLVATALLKEILTDLALELLPLWILLIVTVPAFVIFWLRRRREPGVVPESPPLTFPPPVERLIGRDEAVRQVVRGVEARGLAVVQGSKGLGTSAVATAAAWEIEPQPDRQRYADLRGQDRGRPEPALSVARRTLGVLGLQPGAVETADAAAALIGDALRTSGLTLLLDNVQDWDQVAWLPRAPSARIVVAGLLAGTPVEEEPIPIGSLSEEDGLRLLRAKVKVNPGRLAPAPRDPLLRSFLRNPVIVLTVAAWLDHNGGMRIGDLADDLRSRSSEADVLATVRRRLSQRLSPHAARLLSVLAHLPVEEVTTVTLARVAGLSERETAEAVQALLDNCLVERPRSPSRVRAVDGASLIVEPPRDGAAVTRALVGQLAAQADAHGRRLPGDEHARRWFAAEDTALLKVLSAAPPVAASAYDIWRIGDALETWFNAQHRQTDRLEAARRLAAAAHRLRDREANVVAELRCADVGLALGVVGEARRHLARAWESLPPASRPPQLHLAQAAVHLTTQEDLTVVEAELARYRQALPSGDAQGLAVAQVNIGALLLSGGALDSRRVQDAHKLLGTVAASHDQNVDLGTKAHATELRALADWRLGKEQEARAGWRRAAGMFRRTGEPVGEGRCTVHLGTSLVGADPAEAARLLRAGRGRLPGTGLPTALACLYLARLEPAQARGHVEAGLDALAPWADVTEPSHIGEIRRRLEELATISS